MYKTPLRSFALVLHFIQSATLKQQIGQLENRVETAVARTAEVEANISRSVEDGLRTAEEEVAAARRREEEEAKAAGEAKEALAAARSDLEKAKRELKQRGQLARNLLAEKDAEINRLRSGGGVGGGGGDLAAHLHVNGGDGSGAMVAGRRSPSGSVDGGLSSPQTATATAAAASPGGGSPWEQPRLNGRSLHGVGSEGGTGAGAGGGALGGGGGGANSSSPGFAIVVGPGGFGGGRKRLQGAAAAGGVGGGGGGATAQPQQTAAESHHAEQQILQMARVQAQRDEETGRLRVKIQRLTDEIRVREDALSARDAEKDGLRKRVEELQGEAARAKELLDDATGPEKLTYLKNVVKRFVMSDGTERQRLVPVVATILSFSPAETSEVDKAVAASVGGAASSWGSVFG